MNRATGGGAPGPVDPVARWGEEVRRRLAAARLTAAGELAIVEEVALHLEERYGELVARGLAAPDARRQVLLELEADGGFGADVPDPVGTRPAPLPPAGGGAWYASLGGELRYAVRVLSRARGFTAVAVLTLALGVGATTAMFSLVHALLLRPLPYPEVARLATVVAPGLITPANLADWSSGAPSLERLTGFRLASGVLQAPAQARRLRIMQVDEALLPLLGARPVRGRLWTAREARAGAAPVALVSERLWREVLGGAEPGARALTLDGTAYEVIGVLSSGFHNLGYTTDVWLPLGERPVDWLTGVARLRAGASREQAQAELAVVAERVEGTPLAAQFGRSVRVHGLREVLTGDVRTPLLVLFGAALCVLLLACANLANLLLSRAAGRGHELAIRSALGAGRGALLRQLTLEHFVLALAGGGAGLLLAWVCVRGVVALMPPHFGRLPLAGVGIDGVVLAVTLAAALLSTLAAGVGPAVLGLRAADSSAAPARVTPGRSSRLWREALVAAEVAIALTLLIGTTLLVRTYLTLRPASPGFETRDRIVAALTLADDAARNEETVRRLTRELERVIPGGRVAAAHQVPLSGMAGLVPVLAIDGEPVLTPPGERPPLLDVNAVTPNYTEVLGIRLVSGRALSEGDAPGAASAAVINRSAARRFWPDAATPLGRRLTVDLPDGAAELVVVGVTEDARTSGASTAARAQALVSYWQAPWRDVHLVVHVPPGSGFDAGALRSVVATVDPALPVGEPTPLAVIAAGAVADPRYQMALMSGFGALALLLAVIGCYGVLAYSVSQRTREFGVRMALGADRRAVLGHVLRRAGTLIAAGLLLGTALALATTRVLRGSLYGVEPTDPATFAASATVLLLVSLLAALLPARRAARVEPVTALRAE